MNAVGTPVRTLVMALAAMTVGLLGALVAAPHGHALPPGGASTDTEGTAGTVSPRTLGAGEVLSFSISGFPAGETVNVKIDDGEFCSQKGVHGACVVHQQKIAADGTVKGSFALPGDLKAGKHWLRFLASAEIFDEEGRYVGVKPYSLRGETDFAVVDGNAASGPKKDGRGGTPASSPVPETTVPEATGAPEDGESTTGATTPQGDAPKTGALQVPAPPGAATTATAVEEPSATESGAVTVGSGPPQEPTPAFPAVGTAVLVAALLVAGLLVLRRRPTA